MKQERAEGWGVAELRRFGFKEVDRFSTQWGEVLVGQRFKGASGVQLCWFLKRGELSPVGRTIEWDTVFAPDGSILSATERRRVVTEDAMRYIPVLMQGAEAWREFRTRDIERLKSDEARGLR